MKTLVMRSWKALAWRGVVSLSFSLVALLKPDMLLTVLTLLFSIYTLLDGIVAVVSAPNLAVPSGTPDLAREHAWAFLLEGFAGLGLCLAAFSWTQSAAELLALLIAFWAIAKGALEIIVALRLRHELQGHSLVGLAGVSSVILGCASLRWPRGRIVWLTVLLGSYALVLGAAMLAQAFRLRRDLRRLEQAHERFGPKSQAV
jgi:uncharacterized membrane protein HdeD (DUF308 family)